MKLSFDLRDRGRATTALCVVSTLAIVTASYGADWGRSNWDKRKHNEHHHSGQDNGNNNDHDHGHDNDHDNHGNDHGSASTESPIKHVIILIGENRGLDHTFGVYRPKGKGQTISNLLSKGIVNEDGTPGPNFALAQQYSVAAQPSYYIGAPKIAKFPYNATNGMPQPNTAGTPTVSSDTAPPFKTVAEASVEKDIDPSDLDILTTGASNLPTNSLDTRVPGAGTLAGPFPLQGPAISDDDYTGDTTHRFYQAWQQQNCSIDNATKQNPTGCLSDLFPFVMASYSATNKSQGNSMGFYNAEQEQAPVLKMLADRFTLSDNFHQSFQGGTGANHFMLGTGDAGYWSDGNGNAITPPASCSDRESESEAGYGQPVHRRRQFQCVRRHLPAWRPADRELSGAFALRCGTELQAASLLYAQQYQPGLLAERCSAGGTTLPPQTVR